MFFFFYLALNIVINIEIRPGQIDLNILLREVCESLMNKILIQKNIKINKAGGGFSYFITSFKKDKTEVNLS